MSKKNEAEISKKLEKLSFRPISKGPLETIKEEKPKKEESKKRPKSEGARPSPAANAHTPRRCPRPQHSA